MTTGESAPPGVDTSRPSIARVYDFMLGGKDNFAVDRQAAELALKITPDGPEAGRASRAFLRRVVRYLVTEAGIRQFLDIGSGLPTQGNVHEIAHQIDKSVRVVYVDNDPMVHVHSQALLADARTTVVVEADLRRPEEVLRHPEVAKVIDFREPVGLLLLAILHHLNDHEEPGGVTARLVDALPSGSYVALSHFHDPGEAQPEVSRKAREVEKIFNQTLGTGRWRTREEVASYLAGLTIIEPGVVPLAQWRPDDEPPPEQTDTYHTILGGVARKP